LIYKECSAVRNEGVDDLFRTITLLGILNKAGYARVEGQLPILSQQTAREQRSLLASFVGLFSGGGRSQRRRAAFNETGLKAVTRDSLDVLRDPRRQVELRQAEHFASYGDTRVYGFCYCYYYYYYYYYYLLLL
jgi:hypothetical protein